MKKETAKDIAICLIARSGQQFDEFAFENSKLPERDKGKILNEINVICQKMIIKVEKKYKVANPPSTYEIVNLILT